MTRTARRPVRTIRRLSPAGALALAAGAALSASNLALAGADLPVERVTLYRSGVGYFEHAGALRDDATVGVRFETKKINDVLKSMVVFDFDGGRIGGVRYEPKSPLSE